MKEGLDTSKPMSEAPSPDFSGMVYIAVLLKRFDKYAKILISCNITFTISLLANNTDFFAIH